MGFVKTPEEIARIEHALSHPRFVNGEMLAVDFLSDPDVVASVLPPPLQAAEEPLLSAMVGRWQSNCVGDFYGGAIYVAARHDGIEGRYVLAMWMDGDVPTIYGRDLFGEPKKLAESRLHRRGDEYSAWLERGGVRLLELHAQLPTDLGNTAFALQAGQTSPSSSSRNSATYGFRGSTRSRTQPCSNLLR